MTKISVYELIKKEKIEKLSSATNIFNKMKSIVLTNEAEHGFELDMKDVKYVSSNVFKDIIKKMKSEFEGEYKVSLVNANVITTQMFKQALS